MKRKPLQIFLVIAISSFTLVFPAYLRCSNLAETNLFSTDLSFENADQDDQFLDQLQHELKAFVLSAFFIIFLPGVNAFEKSHHFSFQTALIYQNNSILRC